MKTSGNQLRLGIFQLNKVYSTLERLLLLKTLKYRCQNVPEVSFSLVAVHLCSTPGPVHLAMSMYCRIISLSTWT